MPYLHEQDFTQEEQRRLEKNLCLKCGKRITKQTYYGSLCSECNEDYFTMNERELKLKHIAQEDAQRFLEFIRDRKERVAFT